MFRHGPSPLNGPITRIRGWWCEQESSNSCALLPEPEDNMNKQADECWREDPEIRVELVERVRREIAAGTYDTPEKFELALERLLDRLEEE